MSFIEFNLRIDWHRFKNWWLRIKNGAGCCDIFGLDYYLAKKIIKPLKVFRSKENISHPSELKNYEEWREILDKMIWSFDYLLDGEEMGKMFEKEFGKNVNIEKQIEWAKREQEGFELFGKYFRNLWI